MTAFNDPGNTFVLRMPAKGPSEMIFVDAVYEDGEDIFQDNEAYMQGFVDDSIIDTAGLYFFGTVTDDDDGLHGQFFTVERDQNQDLVVVEGMRTVSPGTGIRKLHRWP